MSPSSPLSAKKTRESSCVICGGPARYGTRGRVSKHCSLCNPRPNCIACGRQVRKAFGGYCTACVGVACATCGVRFFGQPRNTYCSTYCQRRAGATFFPGDFPCDECGAEFYQKNSAYRFCSAKCRRRADKRRNTWERDNWNDKAKARAQERRARKGGQLGAKVERFNPRYVHKRDGWVCGICQQPVESSRVYPDPLSPSIDHIVPLSLGGDHTLDNVQCAHLVCNLSKGNDPNRATIFEEVQHGNNRAPAQADQPESP